MKKGDKPSNRKNPQAEAGRSWTAVWLCLIFFVAAWMFVLGIFVGRGTAPVKFDIAKLQKELAALKEAVIREEKKRFKIDSDSGAGSIDLGFYEELKDIKPKERLNNNIKLKEEGRGIKPPKASLPEKKVIPVPTQVKPAARATEPVKTASTPQARSAGSFTIQVASLKDPEAAGAMVDRLKAKGYPAYKTVVKIPEKGVWFRVRIGKFNDRDAALAALGKLHDKQIEGFVVRD